MAGPHAQNSPKKSSQVRNGCLPDITGGRVSGLAWRSRAAEWSCPGCIGRAEAVANSRTRAVGSRLSIRPANAELALLTMRAAMGGAMLNPPRRTARGEELTGDEPCCRSC